MREFKIEQYDSDTLVIVSDTDAFLKQKFERFNGVYNPDANGWTFVDSESNRVNLIHLINDLNTFQVLVNNRVRFIQEGIEVFPYKN
jgi:hypothetical protein